MDRREAIKAQQDTAALFERQQKQYEEHIENARKTAAEAKESASRITEENTSLKQQLEECQQQLQTANARAAEFSTINSKHIAELPQDKDALYAHAIELRDANNSIIKQRDELQQLVEKLSRDIHDRELAYQKLKVINQQLRDEQHAMKDQITKAEENTQQQIRKVLCQSSFLFIPFNN